MLKVVFRARRQSGASDITCPVFACDHCQEIIHYAHTAVYAWKEELASKRPLDGAIYTLHREPCFDAFTRNEEKHGKDEERRYVWADAELTNIVGYLVRNSHLSWDEVMGQHPDAVV